MIEFNIPTNFPSTEKYVLEVLKGKKYGDFGKYYNLSKEFIKEYTGAKEVILTHSATAALELSFQLIEVKKYTALMPSYTFSSTANSVLKSQGKVEFVDVNSFVDIEEIDIDFVEIQSLSFSDLTRKHSISSIDKLQIDVEGSEYEILKSINYKEANINKIIFESKHFDGTFTEGEKLDEIKKKLTQNGYKISKLDKENFLAEKL